MSGDDFYYRHPECQPREEEWSPEELERARAEEDERKLRRYIKGDL